MITFLLIAAGIALIYPELRQLTTWTTTRVRSVYPRLRFRRTNAR
ncbi:hypothetical protein [Actinocorallia longicatena]|uniref:Uncharacterized protein n=1 Tax=Actinocorallia longicatena TaxID=111803 RepID=A0ABP6QDU0_9ACTN